MPSVVQAIQVNPNVPDREGPYIAANIEATRAAYQLDQIDVRPVAGTAVVQDGRLQALDGLTEGIPLVDPQIVSEIFEQQQQVRAYYSVPNVLDVDRYEIAGKDRAVVLGVRELDQSGLAEGDQNWSNLHTAYTHGNGVIAAYANQRPEDDSVQQSGIQWAEGQEADEDALTRLSGPDGYETRVYFGEQSPSYSIVGQNPDGEAVEFDLPKGDRSEEDIATTYDGAAGVPIGGPGQPAALRREVQRAQPAAVQPGARELQDPLRPRAPADGREGRAVADRRLRSLPGRHRRQDPVDPRRLHRHRQVPARAARVARDDDRRLAPADHRLPDAADRRDQLHAQLRQGDGRRVRRHGDALRLGRGGPDPQGVARGLPRRGGALRVDIPDELLEHLRYPEDLFKTQRYQFQRYHETSASAWFEGIEPVGGARATRSSTSRLQPPYRLFTDTGEGETWSLTSVYVPREKENNLAAYMAVNSDATSDDFGKVSVLELPNEPTGGPLQIANTFATNEDVSQALLPYTTGDAARVPGNLLTLPVGDSFMYVQPVYTRREGRVELPHPALRARLLRGQRRHR